MPSPTSSERGAPMLKRSTILRYATMPVFLVGMAVASTWFVLVWPIALAMDLRDDAIRWMESREGRIDA